MRLRDAVIGAVCVTGLAAGCASNRDDVRREPVAIKTQTQASEPMKVTVTEKRTATTGPMAGTSATRTEGEAVARSAGPTQTILHNLEQVGTLREDPRGTLLVFKASDLFGVNDHGLLPDAKRRLDTVAAALKDSSKDRIRIEAFTDGVGGEGDNLELTQKRATEVRDYLARRGVDKDRIDAVGMGATKAVRGNDTAEGRAENRRVEILLPWRSNNLGVGGSGSEHRE